MSPELARLVAEYFQSDDQPSREALVPRIEQESGGSINAVAKAMASAPLWSGVPPAERAGEANLLPSRSGTEASTSILYRLPEDYDARVRYPLILGMPDSFGTADDFPQRTRAVLGSAVDGFVVATFAHFRWGAWCYCDDPTRADVPALLHELRRVFHVDSDRVYVFGDRDAAMAAWAVGIAHADQFAGVITTDGYPRVPYSDQVYPFLLGNLARLPVLSVHTSARDESASPRCRAIARYNEVIDALARREGWPITTLAIDRTPPEPFHPPPAPIAALLSGVRGPSPKHTSHWFRYPAEGHSDWLSQLRFRGEVWEDSQLSILPPAGTPRDAYITEVVQAHLAYLNGRVEGQTITVETRRCAEIELSLPPGLVDFERPVTIRVNGKRRLQDLIRPSIKTMLETAYQRWEFQRPVVARLRFTIPRDALNPD